MTFCFLAGLENIRKFAFKKENMDTQASIPSQYYSSRIASLDFDISRHRRRNRFFVAGEIVLFALFVAFIAVYATTQWGAVAAFLSIVSLVAYVVVRRVDEENEARTEWLTALREVCLRESSYLNADYSAFDDGKRYADAAHPFTTDIDVFGPKSLYQRVCRTVTTGGSDRLAALLSSQPVESLRMVADVPEAFDAELSPIERIGHRADAIDFLACRAEWRTEFCAVGVPGRIDTAAVAGAMHAVCAVKVGRWVLSPVSKTVACLMALGLIGTVVAAASAAVPSGIAVIWAIAQLGVVLGLCHGKLMEASRAIGRLQKQMKAYAKVVRIMCRLHNESVAEAGVGKAGACPELVCRVVSALDGAEKSFAEMEHILAGLDRRGNILALIVADIFTLSDWRLLCRFALWQRRYALDMDRWIASVGEMDALVSMATFRYNEPRAVRAQVVEQDGVVFEAKALCHPFLGEKAVGNDFSIANRNYYIVTGANMAGKSTFLRSLGINWLLAMNGMPVFAEALRLSVFPLFTSMRTTDDLTRGISYFNAELLRLQHLIDFCSCHADTLIILDEILKGTNSADKLAGSRLFLEYISARSVTGIVATHDLELSHLADERPLQFHNYCFEISLGRGVTYTYRIMPGVARNQNATFLLKSLLK